MPKQAAHLKQAQQNRALITRLDPATTPHLDWVVTITFYAALHLIEAWFATKGLHFVSHENRDNWGGKVKELRRVWQLYKELEFQSRQARYQCVRWNRSFVEKNIVPLLSQIEEQLEKKSK